MSDTNKLIATLTEDAVPVTPWRPSRVIAHWLGLAAAYLLAVTLGLGVRPDIMEKLLQPVYAMELLLCGLIAGTAGMAAACLALPDSYQKRWIKWVPFGPIAGLGALLLAGSGIDAQVLFASASTPQYGVVLKLALLAVIPGIFLFVMLRRAAPVECCWAGSMATLAVGSMSYFTLRLVEMGGNTADVMLWCYLPMLLLTMVGMMLGKYLLLW